MTRETILENLSDRVHPVNEFVALRRIENFGHGVGILKDMIIKGEVKCIEISGMRHVKLSHEGKKAAAKYIN